MNIKKLTGTIALKLSDIILCLLFLILGFFFAISQKHFMPTPLLRSISLITLIVIMSLIFMAVKNKEPVFAVSRFLAVFWGSLTFVIIAVNHVIIRFDLSLRHLSILLFSVLCPYLAGLIFGAIKKKS